MDFLQEKQIPDSELERLWFLYQIEGAPNNIPLIEFSASHGVPFYMFDRFANDNIKTKALPVSIENAPIKTVHRGRPRRSDNIAREKQQHKINAVLTFEDGSTITIKSDSYQLVRSVVDSIDLPC